MLLFFLFAIVAVSSVACSASSTLTAAFVPSSGIHSDKSETSKKASQNRIYPWLIAPAVILIASVPQPSVAIDTVSTSHLAVAEVDPKTTLTSQQQGKVLFDANCAGCHAGGLNFVAERKTLKRDALESDVGLDPLVVQKFVQSKLPHKLLPFHQLFTDEDYSDVVSYVLDQALNDRW